MGYQTTFYGKVSKTTGNSTENPNDGSGNAAAWIFTDLPEDKCRHFISVSVYAEADTVTPISPSLTGNQLLTNGTVVITASDDGVNFGAITQGTIDLTKADYIRPNLCGPLRALKIEVKNLTPAIFAEPGVPNEYGVTVKVTVHSYE